MRSSMLVLVTLAVAAQGALLRAAQEPDTACGKGFDNLVGGSQEYFKTALKEIWNHPYHLTDAATFQKEFECWFANMATTKCGGLASQADARKDKLTRCAKLMTPSGIRSGSCSAPRRSSGSRE